MAKGKTVFYCTECGNETPKWQGKCPACGAWNTIVEQPAEVKKKSPASRGVLEKRGPAPLPRSLRDVEATAELRFQTGMTELDRVLGGGAVQGSLVLVGGAPGIGKSTLMLQICSKLCEFSRVLYVSGEESERQIKLRAERLKVRGDTLYLLAETNLERILDSVAQLKPDILIVDEALSVGDVFFQVKCYHKFEEFKKMGKTILFVSHDLGSISKYCDRVILLNQGVKVSEGEPKKIVDEYKQVLVRQDEDVFENGEKKAAILESAKDKKRWMNELKINPEVLDYGEKQAEIIDFAIVDSNGVITSNIEKNSEFTLKMKVQFKEDIQDPIFAFTIKDLQGTEVTGTNTMYENVQIGPVKAGDIKVGEFVQKMTLQGRNYLISFGCVGVSNNRFNVYHRLYDVCNINVISDKDTVGFFDMNSIVTVSDEK